MMIPFHMHLEHLLNKVGKSIPFMLISCIDSNTFLLLLIIIISSSSSRWCSSSSSKLLI